MTRQLIASMEGALNRLHRNSTGLLGLRLVRNAAAKWNASQASAAHQIRFTFADPADNFTVALPSGLHSRSLEVRVHDPVIFSWVVFSASLGLAEAYIARKFEITTGTLYELISVIIKLGAEKQQSTMPSSVGNRLYMVLRRRLLLWRNRLTPHHQNIRTHYDEPGLALYRDMLDAEHMMYTCGYNDAPQPERWDEACPIDFDPGAIPDLDRLQRNKLRRVGEKLGLRPDENVLDLGCGYGGAMAYLAREYGIRGQGITISHLHCEEGARNLERILGSERRQRVTLTEGDVREVIKTVPTGSVDAVVSIGLFEHVRQDDYPDLFREIHRVLNPRTGRGLIHAISAEKWPRTGDPFIQKYVFPGSTRMRISGIVAELERYAMNLLDIEEIGRHYFYTLYHWHRNSERHFAANPGKYPEEFRRMWDYFLQGSMANARHKTGQLHQVLFAKNGYLARRLQRV